MEGTGKKEALATFMHAWDIATNNSEKFIAAHYIARHQQSVQDKLKWDLISLELAQTIDDPEINACYPSLYLNTAKCYEDLGNMDLARSHYHHALHFCAYLADEPYSKMIRAGIQNGIARVA